MKWIMQIGVIFQRIYRGYKVKNKMDNVTSKACISRIGVIFQRISGGNKVKDNVLQCHQVYF